MKLSVQKSILKGTVRIPSSKSHTIRAVAIGSLAQGQSTIGNPLVSADTQSAVNCYRALGAKIDTADSRLWKVTGTGGRIECPEEFIDVGNSGTTLRIAAGSGTLAQSGEKVRFTGDQQTQTRPVGPLLEALNKLGAKCVSINDNGKAPIEITGKLRGGKTSIRATTSQYLSSLLLCTPLAQQDSVIDVTLLNEPGYVQMTLDWLDREGIKYENQQMRKFKIKGNQRFKRFDYTIPADFSSATFFLCAGALAAEEINIAGLDFADSQPDKAVVDYLQQMGADINIIGNRLRIKRSTLRGAELDMNGTPDAMPAMAVTAAFAQGQTRLVNVPQARGKETDRIRAMATELGRLGVKVEELPDGLIIEGGGVKAADVHGWGDHRIVMALSLAGLVTEGSLVVDTAEAMNVTFPGYVELMRSIGAQMEIET